MVLYALLHVRYFIRPSSDHTEVRYSFELISHGSLITYQGICRHEEQSVDRLLPFFLCFGTVCLRDVPCDLFCITIWYVPSRQSLKGCPRQTPIPKAMVIPDLPFDEYQFCEFQPWRTGKVTSTVLSLVYGTPLSVV